MCGLEMTFCGAVARLMALLGLPCCLQLGPLRNVEGVAEIVGCVNGAAVVLLLALCLSIYGQVTFQAKVRLGPLVPV